MTPVTVGVLLPVRVETRFYPGKLRVRIVPDEPWFARDDHRISQGEIDALRRYLDADAAAATGAHRAQAWREFVVQVGGARAVYLIRTYVDVDPAGTRSIRELADGELRDEPAFPRLLGFPANVDIWVARGGGPPAVATTLNVKWERLLVDFPDPDSPADRRWWEDWDEAVDAGLACELGLVGDPTDIDALYVTGLGDDEPRTLFASHRDAGRIGLLPPGSPTNAVDGVGATSLDDDPATWWDVLNTGASETDRLVSRALTGDPDVLGKMPGSAENHRLWSHSMVGALWPALWGFAGEDVWGIPKGTAAAASWAPDALLPEGPYPTLRIGSQPYGLLPATALGQWVAAPGDPAAEAGLAVALPGLRAQYAQAAENRGTVVGANTEQLLDLIGQLPTSPLFRHRRAWPLEVWWIVLHLLGYNIAWDDLDRAWQERHPDAKAIGLQPARRYGAASASARIGIPLVTPDTLPAGQSLTDALQRIVDIAVRFPNQYARTDVLEAEWLRFAPDSLLLRLVIRSLQVAIGDVGRSKAGERPPGPEPVVHDSATAGRLEAWISSTGPNDVRAHSPEAQQFRTVCDCLLDLAKLVVDEPERAERILRATVDTAAYRIDPWLVGLPARRLDDLLAQGTAQLRLGVYGWVDGPRPGTPGPTAAGLIHSPSPSQTLVATVIRDRAVNDPDSARWKLNLDSRRVRHADRIAEFVRVGAHLPEALGREVERVVGDPDDIKRLRSSFPVRTEHEARRVCDGLAVLAAGPASLGLDQPRLAALQELRETMDTFGDLLVAEAVNDVTQGRAEVAGAVLDAAAGLSRPPHLDVLHTPREGRAAATGVVVVLADAAAPAVPAGDLERLEISPAAIVDSAVAAFMTAQVGDDWSFTVDALDEAGQGVGAPTAVTLGDLGLRPADALSISRTDLERLAVERGADVLGVEGAVLTGGDGAARYEAAARLVALIGRRPADPGSVAEAREGAPASASIGIDLLARYVALRSTAVALVTRLSTEVALTVGGEIGTADPLVLARLLTAARSWGVAPDPRPDLDSTGQPKPNVAERRLVARTGRAVDLLSERIAAAPDTLPPAAGKPSPAAGLARDELIAAIVALASPTGQIALTARLSRGTLPPLASDDAADDTWLPMIAAVREPLARLEVHQLTAGMPTGSGPRLSAFSNKPADSWQLVAGDARRLVRVYTPASLDLQDVPDATLLAVALIDSFTEVIPAQEQNTAAAFGFDAPAARAPQAILLVVPPDLQSPLDQQTLVETIAETRQLARARVARPGDIAHSTLGMLPTALVPADGHSGVPLDPA